MIRGKDFLASRDDLEGLFGAHEVRLDLDGTDDPTHGGQEGTPYHGYYRQRMYHPLLVFCPGYARSVTLPTTPIAAIRTPVGHARIVTPRVAKDLVPVLVAGPRSFACGSG